MLRLIVQMLDADALFLYLLLKQNVNELNQWLSAIRKVSIYNERMLPSFHPGAHRSGKWTCCLQADRAGNPGLIISNASLRTTEFGKTTSPILQAYIKHLAHITNVLNYTQGARRIVRN